jgi:hypothetical protein
MALASFLREVLNARLDGCRVTLDQDDNRYLSVNRNELSIRVYCYFDEESFGSGNGKAGYILSFDDVIRERASCRVFEAEDVAESIWNWLYHGDLKKLWASFEFVDVALRATLEFERIMLQRFPELIFATRVMSEPGDELYKLEFGNRVIRVRVGNLGAEAELYFDWDDCFLFHAQGSQEEAMEVIFRYLINAENPSSLAVSFPWIKTNELSDGYEQGRGMESEFAQSWEDLILFFHEFDQHPSIKLSEAIALFEALKELGFGKTLRAGSSLLLIMLSRSRRNGLRQDQMYLAFFFSRDGKTMTVRKKEEPILENVPVVVTEEILNLLQELEKLEID